MFVAKTNRFNFTYLCNYFLFISQIKLDTKKIQKFTRKIVILYINHIYVEKHSQVNKNNKQS